MTKRILFVVLLGLAGVVYGEPNCSEFPVFAQDLELATPKTFLYRYFKEFPFKRLPVTSDLPVVQSLIKDHSEINRIIRISMPLNKIFQNVESSVVGEIYIGLIKGDYWNAALVLPSSLSAEDRAALFAGMDERFETDTAFEAACTYYVFSLQGQMRLYVEPSQMVIHASRTIVQLDMPSN